MKPITSPLFLILLFISCLSYAGGPHLLAMTYTGGSDNSGVLFSYNVGDSIVSAKYELLNASNEALLNSLMLANNGKVYGLDKGAGINHKGTLFEYNPVTGISTIIVNFDFYNTGAAPAGHLIQATNGKLYGLLEGGFNNGGFIFSYAIDSSSVTILYNLPTNACPHGSLIQATNGKLYGMTLGDGTHQSGTIFEYNIDSAKCTVDFNFPDSSYPWGSLIEVGADTFYGLTSNYSGSTFAGQGSIFRYIASTGAYDTLHLFPFGNSILGALLHATDNKLYGYLGFSNGSYAGTNGNIFSYDISSGIYTDIYDCSDPLKGNSPEGELFQASDGMLYGMMLYGGVYNKGTIFQYDPITSTYTKEVDMDSATGSLPAGRFIECPLLGTGITPIPETNIKIYGKTGAIIIERPDASPASVIVTNLLGQEVINTNVNSASVSLPVSTTDAIYIVQVIQAGNQTVKKVLVR